MSLYTSKLIIDPKFNYYKLNTPKSYPGFVLMIKYASPSTIIDQDYVTYKTNFYSLFYNIDQPLTQDDSEDYSNLGDFIGVDNKTAVVPVWIDKEENESLVIYNLRFIIPVNYTTNEPYAFALCYIDTTIEGTIREQLKPVFLSNRALTNGLSVNVQTQNQGRFNEGYNSIVIVTKKNTFKPRFLPSKTIADSLNLGYPLIETYNTLFDRIVTSKIDKLTTIEHLVIDYNDNTKNTEETFQLTNGFCNLFPYKSRPLVPSDHTLIINRHSYYDVII